jgi:hypothetical protein
VAADRAGAAGGAHTGSACIKSAEQIAPAFQVFWEEYSVKLYVSRQYMDFI